MFYDDIKEKLNKLKDSEKLNPDKQWKQENKEALLSEIETEKEEPATISEKVVSLCDVLLPYRVVAASKMAVFIFFLVFGVIGGWTATVQASYSSVPGDTLYNVKMVAEEAQLTMAKMTGNQAEEAKLHSEFATRRAKEVEKILKNDKDPNKAKQAIKSMNKSIDKAKDSLKQANESGNKDAVNSTQKILNNNEIIKETLSKVLVDMSDGSATLADDIVIVQGKINAGSLQILEYMVRSQLEDKVDLSKEEAQALVINTISALSKSSVDTSNISDSMDKKAINKITKGVISKVENKKGEKIGAGLTRKDSKQKEDKETEKDKETKADKEKNKEEEEKEKTEKDESEQESSEESETNDKEESSGATTSTTSTTSTTASSKTGTTTEKNTSSSPEAVSSSVSLAKQLAQKGKLLEAIEKAQSISSKNTEQLLKMVKTKVDKEKNKVFLELDHEGQIITSTVEYSQNSTSSDKSTTTEKSKEESSATSSEKAGTTTTKVKEEDKGNQKSTSTEETTEKQDESAEQAKNNESNQEKENEN